MDLVIRKGAGSDLFPGESSGYNSSASSVTGDQSPSWEDTKRLSVVKEEAAELEDRYVNNNAIFFCTSQQQILLLIQACFMLFMIPTNNY